jgi:hypothetical protein
VRRGFPVSGEPIDHLDGVIGPVVASACIADQAPMACAETEINRPHSIIDRQYAHHS